MPVREVGPAVPELICEYLEAVTHELIYRRGVYDPNIFERERLYGIAVHKSRHPELNLYISDSILSIKACPPRAMKSTCGVFLKAYSLPAIQGLC